MKIEFGARAGTAPSTSRTLTPYVADLFPLFVFPTATVDVLNAERTFWEKFTLAHAESGRAAFKNSERFSRHWYDLAMLADHDVGASGPDDLALLDQVVVMKDLIFNVGGVDYNDCATGRATLVPSGTGLTLLRSDYEAMVASGMLDETH